MERQNAWGSQSFSTRYENGHLSFRAYLKLNVRGGEVGGAGGMFLIVPLPSCDKIHRA